MIYQKIVAFLLLWNISISLYLGNAGFDLPNLVTGESLTVRGQGQAIQSWEGRFVLLAEDYFIPNFGQGQFINLVMNGNGILKQNVQIDGTGTMNLTFKMFSQSYSESNQIQISWNNVSLQTLAVPLQIVTHSITVDIIEGANTLEILDNGRQNQRDRTIFIDSFKLQAISMVFSNNQQPNTVTQNNSSLSINNQLAIIDQISPNNQQSNQASNVSTVQENNQLQFSQQFLYATSVTTDVVGGVFNLPINQISGLKYLGILVEDLWLYLYDRQYDGIIKLAFTSIEQIEQQKWAITMKALSIQDFNETLLPVSDYTLFSSSQIIQTQGKDNFMFKNLFNFFLFNIEQMMLLCLLLYLAFKMTFNYCISIYFRKYHFYCIALLQILFQMNISYFTYLGILQLKIIFAFKFIDKIFIIFSVFFLGIVVIFAFSFYFLSNHFIGKKFGYFMYFNYRTFPGIAYMTLKFGIRGVSKAFIHFFLHNYYLYQILALCGLETVIIVWSLYAQFRHGIFIFKTFFVLTLAYHFQIILLSVSLYIQEAHKGFSEVVVILCRDLQGLIIIIHILVGVLTIIADLLPRACFQRPKRIIKQLINNIKNPNPKKTFIKMVQTSNKLEISEQKLMKSNLLPSETRMTQISQVNVQFFAHQKQKRQAQQSSMSQQIISKRKIRKSSDQQNKIQNVWDNLRQKQQRAKRFEYMDLF